MLINEIYYYVMIKMLRKIKVKKVKNKNGETFAKIAKVSPESEFSPSGKEYCVYVHVTSEDELDNYQLTRLRKKLHRTKPKKHGVIQPTVVIDGGPYFEDETNREWREMMIFDDIFLNKQGFWMPKIPGWTTYTIDENVGKVRNFLRRVSQESRWKSTEKYTDMLSSKSCRQLENILCGTRDFALSGVFAKGAWDCGKVYSKSASTYSKLLDGLGGDPCGMAESVGNSPITNTVYRALKDYCSMKKGLIAKTILSKAAESVCIAGSIYAFAHLCLNQREKNRVSDWCDSHERVVRGPYHEDSMPEWREGLYKALEIEAT